MGGSATEAGNGQISARVVLPGGAPAKGALVYAREISYLRDTAETDAALPEPNAIADGNGSFSLVLSDRAAYKLEVRDSAGMGWMVSVLGGGVGQKNVDIGTDTVHHWGIVKGKVQLPEELPDHAFIQVLGLERTVRTDSAGYFQINDLPPGLHLIRAVSARRGWSYPGPIQVLTKAGETLSLPLVRLITFAEEDYSLWPYSRSLNINTGGLALKDTVTDFPLLVRLDATHFDFQLSDGKDLRFSSSKGNPLHYQIDHWDPAHQDGAVWVWVDSIFSGADAQTITMHWGKRDCPDFSDGQTVFNSFSGVWHFSEAIKSGAGAYFRDASPSKADARGTVLNDLKNIGPAAGFKTKEALVIPQQAALRPDSELTLSLWVKADSSDARGGFFTSFGENFGVWLQSNGALSAWVVTEPLPADSVVVKNYLRSSDGNIWKTGWRHVAMSYDGKSLRLYLDGVQIGTKAVDKPMLYPDRADIVFGQHSNRTAGWNLHGSMDEVQLTAKARSASWLRLSYENQKAGSTLLEFK